jgi:phosphoribosylamine--glycine ligase
VRFLGVGDCADLAALYLRLVEDGHEVKVFIGHLLCQDTLTGLVDRVTDWRAELDWVRGAGLDGCILFENVGGGRG